MRETRLRELLLEAKLSENLTPEERLKTAFENVTLALKLRYAVIDKVDSDHES